MLSAARRVTWLFIVSCVYELFVYEFVFLQSIHKYNNSKRDSDNFRRRIIEHFFLLSAYGVERVRMWVIGWGEGVEG